MSGREASSKKRNRMTWRCFCPAAIRGIVATGHWFRFAPSFLTATDPVREDFPVVGASPGLQKTTIRPVMADGTGSDGSLSDGGAKEWRKARWRADTSDYSEAGFSKPRPVFRKQDPPPNSNRWSMQQPAAAIGLAAVPLKDKTPDLLRRKRAQAIPGFLTIQAGCP